MLYRRIVRPLFFKTDPEWIHGLAIRFMAITSHNSWLRKILKRIFFVCDSKLEVKIGNLKFPNPVGLAAGFDKNIEAPFSYGMLGFGFVEFGSITLKGQPGNPKPRLWRLPADKSLIVYYGLVNNGACRARRILKKIKKEMDIPFGVSIAPSTGVEKSYMVSDYINSFYELYKHADYIVFNVSCPNVVSCEVFEQIGFISELLLKVSEIKKRKNIQKDIFIKLGPDMGEAEVNEVVDLCIKYGVSGIVATNLIKKRDGLRFKSNEKESNHPGGISGKLLNDKSNHIIKMIRQRAGNNLAIIGVGGIFSADDAYEKIKAGANAVQMVTGFVYEGPFVVRKINKELVNLMK